MPEDGFCACGCGERTAFASRTVGRLGWVKGKPRKFVRGHNARRPSERFIAIGADYELDPATECWVWLKTKTAKGYGVVQRGKRRQFAHRFYFEKHHGPTPGDHVVHHRCGNPSCVNPDHLELLPRKAHDRHHFPSTPTPDVVREIRRRAANGETQVSLAARFGVAQPTVSRIVNRQRWADVL